MVLEASLSAARMASFTAATIMSWSISTSSGSTASGSMVRFFSSCLPFTVADTTPPPALASYSFSCSSCCIRIISCCIFWACLSIFMFTPPIPAIPRPPKPFAIKNNSFIVLIYPTSPLFERRGCKIRLFDGDIIKLLAKGDQVL